MFQIDLFIYLLTNILPQISVSFLSLSLSPSLSVSGNVSGIRTRSRLSSQAFDDTGSLGYPPHRVVCPRDFHPSRLPPVSFRRIRRLHFSFSLFSCFSSSPGASAAEWLERVVAVREVPGSSPDRD